MSTTARTLSGDLLIPRVIVTDPASVAMQSIRDILALWQGEWFMDLGVGFPWLQQVLGVVNPNVTAIKATLTKAILAAPYVIRVAATLAIDRTRRAFAYTFAATLNTGEVITGGSNQAFSVQAAPGNA